MILIAGPYRSGTNDDPNLIAENVRAMNVAALRVFRAGHIPMLGERLALPLAETAGSQHIGDEAFTEIFHPVAEAIAERCDACLRIGGPSQGADNMVKIAERLGQKVFYRIEDIPGISAQTA
jgi:precorrin-2 methylase